MPRQQSPFAFLTLAVVLLIAYGCLYPFHFQARPDSPGPLRSLAATYQLHDSRGDILANILLYLPFGFFAIQMLRRRAPIRGIAAVTLAGMALSTSLELLQFYLPGRESSLADIFSNTTGSFLGAGAGILLYQRFQPALLQPVRQHLSSALILACWLGYRLFPYVPVIDLHKYWHAVRPLLIAPALSPWDLYRHTVTWLALALLVDELCETEWSRIVFLLFVGTVLCLRIVIVDTFLSPAEVAGAAMALLAWTWLARLSARKTAIFLLFAILIVLQALEPFHFSATPHPFTWVPFQGFLHGAIGVNVRSFLEKTFLYGALVWLARRAGCSWRVATLGGAGLVLGLRLLQVYIPGRSAEVSDAIILLLMGGAIRLLDQNPVSESETRRWNRRN